MPEATLVHLYLNGTSSLALPWIEVTRNVQEVLDQVEANLPPDYRALAVGGLQVNTYSTVFLDWIRFLGAISRVSPEQFFLDLLAGQSYESNGRQCLRVHPHLTWLNRYDRVSWPRNYHILPVYVGHLAIPYIPIPGGPQIGLGNMLAVCPELAHAPYSNLVFQDRVRLGPELIRGPWINRALPFFQSANFPLDCRLLCRNSCDFVPFFGSPRQDVDPTRNRKDGAYLLNLTNLILNYPSSGDIPAHPPAYLVEMVCRGALQTENEYIIERMQESHWRTLLNLLEYHVPIRKGHLPFLRKCHARGHRLYHMLNPKMTLLDDEGHYLDQTNFLFGDMIDECADLVAICQNLISLTNICIFVDLVQARLSFWDIVGILFIVSERGHLPEMAQAKFHQELDGSEDPQVLFNKYGKYFDESTFLHYAVQVKEEQIYSFIFYSNSITAFSNMHSLNPFLTKLACQHAIALAPRDIHFHFYRTIYGQEELEEFIRTHYQALKIPNLNKRNMEFLLSLCPVEIDRKIISQTDFSPGVIESLSVLADYGLIERQTLIDGLFYRLELASNHTFSDSEESGENSPPDNLIEDNRTEASQPSITESFSRESLA